MIGDLTKSLNLRRGAEGRAAGVGEEVWIGGADGSAEGNRGNVDHFRNVSVPWGGTVKFPGGGLGPSSTPRGCADTKRWGSGEPEEDGGEAAPHASDG